MNDNKYLRWISGATKSIYWHDSAICKEQREAFSNGAVGMTTNPFLINSTLKSDREFWSEELKKVPRGLKGDDKVEALMKLVTCYYARVAEPIFAKSEAGKGYVCAQVNPNRTGEAEYMLAQAQRLSEWAPNIVVKLPATNAGLRAYEECAARGMNVAATVSFTVAQVIAAAEAARRGKERALRAKIKPGLTIAVMMVGRLDDYLRDVARDSFPEVKESDIVQAGVACFKRAYTIFNERGYDTYLMPAGCRGANHITELAGARMIMSVAPKIAVLLNRVEALEERIGIPVEEEVVARLMTMPEFRKAYLPDGMCSREFVTFGSTNRTTDQFVHSGWEPLVGFEY